MALLSYLVKTGVPVLCMLCKVLCCLRWLLFHQELYAADMKLIVEYQILSYFLLLLLLLTSKSAHEVTNRSFQLRRNITLPALSEKGRNITLPAVSVDTSVCFVPFFPPDRCIQPRRRTLTSRRF